LEGGILQRPTNSPTDALFGGNVLLDRHSLLEFWQWAFGDLCDDDVKGIFVEWMVLKLLGIPSSRRISWANSDIITPNNVRIEVKATSYWQSWKLLGESGAEYASPLYEPAPDSRIRFGGLKARNAVNVADKTGSSSLKSHLYVFAFQHQKDLSLWNAMDLSQWEFYILPASEVEQIGGRSIALTALRSKQAPLNADTFIEVARKFIDDRASGSTP
jgi:hypothetical protein